MKHPLFSLLKYVMRVMFDITKKLVKENQRERSRENEKSFPHHIIDIRKLKQWSIVGDPLSNPNNVYRGTVGTIQVAYVQSYNACDH